MRIAQEAELSSDCENQWIMKWPRSVYIFLLYAPTCNLLSLSLSISWGKLRDKFYIDLKLCLFSLLRRISLSLFDYSNLSILLFFFFFFFHHFDIEGAIMWEQKTEDRERERASQYHNEIKFFLRFRYFFLLQAVCFCLGKEAWTEKMVTFSDSIYWYRKIDA